MALSLLQSNLSSIDHGLMRRLSVEQAAFVTSDDVSSAFFEESPWFSTVKDSTACQIFCFNFERLNAQLCADATANALAGGPGPEPVRFPQQQYVFYGDLETFGLTKFAHLRIC